MQGKSKKHECISEDQSPGGQMHQQYRSQSVNGIHQSKKPQIGTVFTIQELPRLKKKLDEGVNIDHQRKGCKADPEYAANDFKPVLPESLPFCKDKAKTQKSGSQDSEKYQVKGSVYASVDDFVGEPDKHVPGKKQEGDSQVCHKQGYRFGGFVCKAVLEKDNPDQAGPDDSVDPEDKQEDQIVEIGGKVGEAVFSDQLVADQDGDDAGNQ